MLKKVPDQKTTDSLFEKFEQTGRVVGELVLNVG